MSCQPTPSQSETNSSTANYMSDSIPDNTIKIITYNLRYDNPRDGLDNWQHRKAHVASFLEQQQAHFVGMQEALHSQIEYLANELKGYDWIGVGRDDGKLAGEFSPIFYQKAAFKPIKTGTFWLSSTPDSVGSRGWDAALPRVATWGLFEHIDSTAHSADSTRQILVINTHFDHKGEMARVNSAKLLTEKARELAPNVPMAILGDFNATPDTEVFQTMTKDSSLADAFEIAQNQPQNVQGTFNGFKLRHENHRIDYIFVNSNAKVLFCDIAMPRYSNGNRQVSDHYPVIAITEF